MQLFNLLFCVQIHIIALLGKYYSITNIYYNYTHLTSLHQTLLQNL